MAACVKDKIANPFGFRKIVADSLTAVSDGTPKNNSWKK